MTTRRPNRVDLHTHSRRSDGVMDPLALYDAMRQYGMKVVALSDHDTLSGYRELRALGLGAAPSQRGPRLIPAVEINTLAWSVLKRHGLGRDGEELHILGYGMDADDPVLEGRLARQRDGRRVRLEATVECLRRAGVPIDDQVAQLMTEIGPGGHDALGRPHIARALMRAGHATSVDDAFDRWIDHGRPCYVPREGMGPREAIDAVREAGGVAILAHSPGAPDRAEVIAELRDWGLAGLEVYYHTFLPETVTRMARFAASQGLLATGGSDYHGDTVTYAEAQAKTFVPGTAGERLLEAIEAAGQLKGG
ncbi:MAG: PHP domain-containing protein [Candidatus Limnocylindrales bacterium]